MLSSSRGSSLEVRPVVEVIAMSLRLQLCAYLVATCVTAGVNASATIAAERTTRTAVLKSGQESSIQPVSRRYSRPYYSYGYRTSYYRPSWYSSPYNDYTTYYSSGPSAYALYLGPGYGLVGTYAYPPALQFSYPYSPYYGGGYYYGGFGYYRPYWGYNPFYGAPAYGYYYW